ncbi:MAG: EAL domain-containing protein [Roseovarius sp.]
MQRFRSWFGVLRAALFEALTGPAALVGLPCLLLLSFWAGGERMLLAASVAASLLLLMALLARARLSSGLSSARGALALRPSRHGQDLLEATLQRSLARAARQGGLASCILLEIGSRERFAPGAESGAGPEGGANAPLQRLRRVLRRKDIVIELGGGRFGIVPAPLGETPAETLMQMAMRLQTAVQTPLLSDDGVAGIGAGFAAALGVALGSGREGETAEALLRGAREALERARATAPSAIKLSAPGITGAAGTSGASELRDEADTALRNGEIRPWFQPQLCTDTGAVSGFEALARWRHPLRGIVPPGQFLPVLETLGYGPRLQELMLRRALGALKAWQAEGLEAPRVSVNFAPDDLRDPTLPDRIAWEVDRHDLSPGNLAVEILETVVAFAPDDTIARNIQRLAEMGFRIDLDDFGTGHASISALKRFSIHRLKIDRSYVRRIDADPGQQRLFAAILSMAEQLELETLAEGVETQGEHALAGQLGCGHVQGFGIARPMPFEQVGPWLRAHDAARAAQPQIRNTSR